MAEAHNTRKKPVVPVPAASPASTSPRPPVNTENTVSMIFGAVVVGIVLLLAISFWRDWRNNQAANETPTPSPEAEVPLVEVEELPDPSAVMTETDEQGERIPVNLPAKYTVKAGDSSWKIAEAFYGSGFNYVDIEAVNNLEPDSELVVGQELVIPRVPVRQTAGGRPAGAYTVQPGTDDGQVGPTKGDTTSEEAILEAPVN